MKRRSDPVICTSSSTRFGDELRSYVTALADAGIGRSGAGPDVRIAWPDRIDRACARAARAAAQRHVRRRRAGPGAGSGQTLAMLTDDAGCIAVAGLADDVWLLSPQQREAMRRLPFDAAAYAQIAGMRREHASSAIRTCWCSSASGCSRPSR